MKKQNILILVLGILIIFVMIFALVFFGAKYVKQKESQNNNQIENGERFDSTEPVYEVNIDINDCLSKDEIKALFDLGDYSDNEMLVYKNDDKEHPIEVWKIKLNEGQDSMNLIRKLTTRRGLFAEEFEDNPELKKLLEGSEGNQLNCVKDVVTLILSNHLQEVNEQTNNWLRE